MFLESSPGFQKRNTLSRISQRTLSAVITVAAISLCLGCAGITPSVSAPVKSVEARMVVTPASASVYSGGQQQFSATLRATSDTAVVWGASSGTISPSGLFTAPTVTSSTKVTVTARSKIDFVLISTSEVTVTPLTRPAIANRSLPAGLSGSPYSTSLQASGGVTPYIWALTSGELPQGLTLDRNSGLISGVTTQTGTFNFTASVTDANSTRASSAIALTIQSPKTANYDGPAELPRVYVQSDLASTPARGNVTFVSGGGDLQQALDNAKCGDTLQLQAGAVFSGKFNFPAQSCDDNHWIIVRTSTADSSLPPEGTRITPCYAGISSLPARPALNCASTRNVMAKLEFDGTGSGPIIFLNGASHYRFIGLEITRGRSTPVVFNLAVREKEGTADHIIFDRSWLHGTTHDETQRGVMLNGMRYAAVIDSYFSDFHCESRKGSCVDAQAIGGGSGDAPMGPFKIVNNFLEASAENILLGGGAATVTAADIEIRRNHMFKPLIWMSGQPGFVGGPNGDPFIVKNLFELKNAQRVLFEDNVLENSWGGFSQDGFGIVMAPKNQAKGTENVCPLCQITDVTVRYVRIRHVGGGMTVASGVSDNGGIALASKRYSIHDIVADDIDGTRYTGFGDFAQISTGDGAPPLEDVTISHVTALQPGVMLNIGDDLAINQPMKNFVFTNNIANAGTVPIKSTGGGATKCAYQNSPVVALPKCFQSYSFTNNAIIATPAKFPASQYPSGNTFPATVSDVGFVDYKGGNGGDYHLRSASPYKNAASDGKNLGADIDALEAAIAGVE